MKQILLFIATSIFTVSGFAQCTVDNSYAGSSAGLYPLGPLGPTCELIAAKTIVSLTDTIVSVTNPIPITATLYITRMKITDITGLPAGLSVSTDVIGSADGTAPWGYWDNPGTVPNQTSALGCAYVNGSQTDWDAAIGGGPNSDGEYPLVFTVDAYIASADPAFVESFVGLPDWVSNVDPSFGGGSFLIYDTLVVASDYALLDAAVTGDMNVSPATQYTYSTPATSGATYDWVATNGTIISGQGTNEVVVEWNGSGNIQVDLTDNSCAGTDNMDVTAITTGLDEVAGINASVYPNPSNGIFTLRLESTDAITISIMDVAGKMVRTEQLSGATLYNIDLQNAPIGVYVMELQTGEGRTFKRLIKN